MMTSVRVKVPASTANLGPGFDTIGMAFQLYTTITMRFAKRAEVILHGEELKGLPTNESNLVYQMAVAIFKLIGMPVPHLQIEMWSDIPLTRGLGSSAAAIVGGLVAANELAGRPFTKEEIYLLSTKQEGHPDNVGASLFGGIVVAAMEDEKVPYLKIDPHESLKALALIPDFQLSTEKARGILPEQYTRQDTIYSLSRTGLLVAALAQGKYELLQLAMKDRLHQPYRASLVPGLTTILENAHLYGALGTALSGAGPTIISLVQGETDPLKQFFQETLQQFGISSSVLCLQPDLEGVQISEDIDHFAEVE
jgi:homoserine kinase